LDKFRGGSVGPKVGQGRIKDQSRDPRPQVEEEENGYHKAYQRGVGHEETTGRTHHCANPETRVTDSNGTVA
jgi:hypothetical protein